MTRLNWDRYVGPVDKVENWNPKVPKAPRQAVHHHRWSKWVKDGMLGTGKKRHCTLCGRKSVRYK